SGSAQPPQERHGGHQQPPWPHHPGQRLPGRPGMVFHPGHRKRHDSGSQEQDLSPFFHHQGKRHRFGTGSGPQDHHRPRRHHRCGNHSGGRQQLHRQVAAERLMQTNRAPTSEQLRESRKRRRERALIALTLALVVAITTLERRRKVFGSRLRTRLVLTFISLSLLPTLFLIFMAWQLLSSQVDYSWDRQVEESLDKAIG